MNDVLSRLRTSLEGRYTVDREIGRGGMSLVFQARDLKHNRNVAIKVLRPELTASIGADRFLSEINIAANLEHPNILPLFDSGDADGLLFYSMPLVEGESLRDRINREGPLPLEDSLQIAREVGDALAYAHEQGIVHRDIKPENILLASGKARVADFGIARARTEAGEFESITDANMAVGTPEYMSPEQASGSDTLDERTDIYSLGCVLYGMLAGEPPFSGRTPQAIIAKHLGEKVPTLSVLRPGVPLWVVRVIEKSLGKVPADRYATVKKFVEALEEPRRRPDIVPIVVAVVLTLIVTGIGIGVGRALLRPEPIVLNSDWVVGFPFPTMGREKLSDDIGQIAALRIGTALEGTDPLVWKWGWDWLSPAQRQDPELVTAQTMDDIARARGARFRISGALVETGNEASVTLFLHDVLLDSTLIQRTATTVAHGDSVLSRVVQAGREILPALFEPGQEVDYAAFEDRDLAATALWMQGEMEYRRSRFETALNHYERAVERDSTLAMAALKGAQSAGWLKEYERAELLVDRALDQSARLPARHLYFAKGLKGWVTGAADSSVYWFDRCLEEEPGWREAHYALGEVYFHLIPTQSRPDTLAKANFEAAIQADSSFTPPLYHLTQIAIRQGNVESAAEMIGRFQRLSPENRFLPPLRLGFECVSQGPESIAWREQVDRDASVVYRAARMLTVAGSHPPCAEAGLQALLAYGGERFQWAAFFALQGLLAAQGRHETLVMLIDSVIDSGTLAAMPLYLIDAIAGSQVEAKALEMEAYGERWGEQYERFREFGDEYMWIGWLYGAWHALKGDSTEVRSLRDILRDRADEADDEEMALYAEALSGHLDLIRHDSTSAIERWSSLSSVGIADSLNASFGRSIPIERLRLAEVLCAQGRYQECLDVASIFDHPGPLIFIPFLPASLALRYQAAVQLGWDEKANEFRTRLDRLGRLDMLPGSEEGW